MRTQHLILIGLVDTDDEKAGSDTIACLNALNEKYSKRCGNVVAKCYAGNSGEALFSTVKFSAMEETTKFVGASGDWEKLPTSKDSTETVGIYVVGNSNRMSKKFEFMTSDDLANAIAGLGPRNIEKICLISCGTAKESPKKESVEGSMLVDFCQSLAKEGARPKIAGYDTYVDVVAKGLPEPRTWDKKTPLSKEQNASLVGKKIGRSAESSSKYRLLQPTKPEGIDAIEGVPTEKSSTGKHYVRAMETPEAAKAAVSETLSVVDSKGEFAVVTTQEGWGGLP